MRTDSLDFIYRSFNEFYDTWLANLKKYRQECFLLKLFSDRQIMILIILLYTSASQDSIKKRFLKKLFSFKISTDQNNEAYKLTLQYLKHHLSSLRIKQSNDLAEVYERNKIESKSSSEECLKKLSLFLQDLFDNGNELMKKGNMKDENQQYLVTLNSSDKNSTEQNLDMNTFCILFNIFKNRLPSSFQILWCTTATSEDIKLFFSRIRTFHYLIFVIMDIDKMHHRLREILLREQDLLTREQVSHGTVYYFSRELTTSRNGLREFPVPPKYLNANESYKQLMTLFQNGQVTQPKIQIIYGTAGIGIFLFEIIFSSLTILFISLGKTHRINSQYKDENLSCFSINDNLNLSSLISSFLLFDVEKGDTNPSIYFNISIN